MPGTARRTAYLCFLIFRGAPCPSSSPGRVGRPCTPAWRAAPAGAIAFARASRAQTRGPRFGCRRLFRAPVDDLFGASRAERKSPVGNAGVRLRRERRLRPTCSARCGVRAPRPRALTSSVRHRSREIQAILIRLKGVSRVKVHPRIPPRSIAVAKVHPHIPPRSIAVAKVHPRIPPRSIAVAKVHPRIPPRSIAVAKVHPRIPPRSIAVAKVHPRTPPPFDEAANVRCEPAAGERASAFAEAAA